MRQSNRRLEAAIARNLAFWRGEQTERPLVGVYLGGYEQDDIYLVAQDGDRLQPQQLTPERFIDLFTGRCKAAEQLDQDLIRPLAPLYCVPWLEAILGCSLRVDARACWAEPLLPAEEPLESLQGALSAAWQAAAVAFVRALVGESYGVPTGTGRFPVAGLFLRGPADVIAALVGTERMCYEFYDHPQQIHRLARLCAEAWIATSQMICHQIPAYRDGYVDPGRWLYAPGQIAYSSEDTASILSAKLYREFFLPYNQVIASAFPYGYIHRHSVSAHHITALLDLETEWAIEVTMDPTGPSVAEMLPIFRQIQDRGRRLIVFGLNSEADVVKLVSALSPRGLCVTVQADTEEQAAALLAAAKKRAA